MASERPRSTLCPEYAHRLERIGGASWKKLLDVQRPYRWNLRRLGLGRVLDVGCGVGRNLLSLDPLSIGVDHSAECVALARSRNLRAYSVEEFRCSELAQNGAFDSLLFAHVLEHMDVAAGDRLVSEYLPFLKRGGKVVAITPQEAGFRTDSTHVRFVNTPALQELSERLGLLPLRSYSFPFPRCLRQLFPYNEFVLVAKYY